MSSESISILSCMSNKEREVETNLGQYGVGTRNAFPPSARQKLSISIAEELPAVNTSREGLKDTVFSMV